MLESCVFARKTYIFNADLERDDSLGKITDICLKHKNTIAHLITRFFLPDLISLKFFIYFFYIKVLR